MSRTLLVTDATGAAIELDLGMGPAGVPILDGIFAALRSGSLPEPVPPVRVWIDGVPIPPPAGMAAPFWGWVAGIALTVGAKILGGRKKKGGGESGGAPSSGGAPPAPATREELYRAICDSNRWKVKRTPFYACKDFGVLEPECEAKVIPFCGGDPRPKKSPPGGAGGGATPAGLLSSLPPWAPIAGVAFLAIMMLRR